MYRVFDPMPIMKQGQWVEQDDNMYYVKDKIHGIVSKGNVVQVDDDLIVMKHNPEKMMLELAKLRNAIREKNIQELYVFLPEKSNDESCRLSFTT